MHFPFLVFDGRRTVGITSPDAGLDLLYASGRVTCGILFLVELVDFNIS